MEYFLDSLSLQTHIPLFSNCPMATIKVADIPVKYVHLSWNDEVAMGLAHISKNLTVTIYYKQ